MNNFVQTNNSGQQWHNAAFASLFDSITAKLPNLTFWAIIFSYVATAGLNCWAIHLPLYLSVPLSLAIQSLRFLTVFTPFLNPHGRASHLPEVIALGASTLALFELSFSLQALGETESGFWSLFLFGSAILVLSMILELQFINQGKKAFGLTTAHKPGATGAVVQQMQNQVQAPPTPQLDPHIDVKALEDEIQFLKNQQSNKASELEERMMEQLNALRTENQLLKSQQSQQGNGQAPPSRRKPKTPIALLNGHSSNGNGHKS